jgi:hypothetical protein
MSTMTGRLGDYRAGVLGRPLAWREQSGIAPTSNTPLTETQAVSSVVPHGAKITRRMVDNEYAASAET